LKIEWFQTTRTLQIVEPRGSEVQEPAELFQEVAVKNQVVSIPVHECTKDGKPGYKYGEAGHCYTYTTGDEESRKHAKQKAYMQAAAIAAQTGEAVKDALSDCVSRKVKILLDEGYKRDQALAIAYSMCGEKQQKSFTDPFPDGEPEVLQGSALVRALQLDISTEQDAAALYMAHADKVLDPEVKETLERVAREEIVHVGEFEALLDSITGGAYSEAVDEGVSEVQGSVHKSFYSKIKKVDDLLHWVTGVVLEPDTVDAQGDQDSGCPTSNYNKAGGVEGTSGYYMGDPTNGHSYYRGSGGVIGDADAFVSATPLTIDTTTYTAASTTKCVVTQIKIDTDAVQGDKASQTLTWRYDEI
jgi:hypothetical protein